MIPCHAFGLIRRRDGMLVFYAYMWDGRVLRFEEAVWARMQRLVREAGLDITLPTFARS